MRINITGTYNDKDIDINITTDADGREWADFVLNMYERMLERAPSFMDRVAVCMPSIANAVRMLNEVCSKLK
jgi:hypothetical protein